MKVMSTPRSWYIRLRDFCNQPRVEFLLILLFIVVLLRLPSFSEPYWYGDEGIYLTIGNALKNGARLYVDIVDHKTPIIYYLAMVPNQFAFRVLLLGWMLVTTSLFYYIAWKWLQTKWPVIIASLVFVLLTTLPWLEGNIPNGELFVMGFVLAGAAIFTKSKFFDDTLPSHLKRKDYALLAGAGLFFGLGILTKVPAVFDLAAFMAWGWFATTHSLWNHGLKSWKHYLPKWLSFEVVLGGAAVLAVVLSAVYFVARGSGQAYLDFGLLYNFRYAGNWALPFTNQLLVFGFSLPGKVLITLLIGILLTWSTKWLKPLWPTLIMWVVLALFAATLSNRPYPHYFLQVIPPLALVLGYFGKLVIENYHKRLKVRKLVIAQLIGTALSVLLVVSVWQLLAFYTYPTLSYYTNFAKLVTGQVSPEDYANSFNSLLAENRAVAQILAEHPGQYLLVWGTNPMLYAVSGKQPVGRFTVVFHIKDFDAYQETLDALKAKNPYYVVVMKDETMSFPELNTYLDQNYMPSSNYQHLTLWKQR